MAQVANEVVMHPYASGAVRMGRAPYGVIISEPHDVSWPTD